MERFGSNFARPSKPPRSEHPPQGSQSTRFSYLERQCVFGQRRPRETGGSQCFQSCKKWSSIHSDWDPVLCEPIGVERCPLRHEIRYLVSGVRDLRDDDSDAALPGGGYGGPFSSCDGGGLRTHRHSIFEITGAYDQADAAVEAEVAAVDLEDSEVDDDAEKNRIIKSRYRKVLGNKRGADAHHQDPQKPALPHRQAAQAQLWQRLRALLQPDPRKQSQQRKIKAKAHCQQIHQQAQSPQVEPDLEGRRPQPVGEEEEVQGRGRFDGARQIEDHLGSTEPGEEREQPPRAGNPRRAEEDLQGAWGAVDRQSAAEAIGAKHDASPY